MKTKKNNMSQSDQVEEYTKNLGHPLKSEIEMVRSIIKKTNLKIRERIKWNAPSYYFEDAELEIGETDMVTFNLRNAKLVHLVFHHAAIIQIQSHLLSGDYKDRRMAYFKNIDEVNSNKTELEKIMKQLIQLIIKTKI
jgi:hypothetical protein